MFALLRSQIDDKTRYTISIVEVYYLYIYDSLYVIEYGRTYLDVPAIMNHTWNKNWIDTTPKNNDSCDRSYLLRLNINISMKYFCFA